MNCENASFDMEIDLKSTLMFLLSFYGASYIHLPVQEAKGATDISFRFRTHLSDAMLLLAAGKTDYCLIKLEAGRLKNSLLLSLSTFFEKQRISRRTQYAIVVVMVMVVMMVVVVIVVVVGCSRSNCIFHVHNDRVINERTRATAAAATAATAAATAAAATGDLAENVKGNPEGAFCY
ncbi:chondroitin sulfate proteoglycan 4 [Vespula maculifrons]|uniref:Chondroitin sulfate proteoglycan 4 n=1 Tax=Vespula maculifrons TaxID=7453 RepID=A0ABD2BII7_VESMC